MVSLERRRRRLRSAIFSEQLMDAEPCPKLRPDERLDSFSPRRPQAELVASTLNANADIKKRAARMFQLCDLGQRIADIRAPRKFKVISIRQFPNGRQRGMLQHRKLMVAYSLLAGERCHKQLELGCLFFKRGQANYFACNHVCATTSGLSSRSRPLIWSITASGCVDLILNFSTPPGENCAPRD